MLRQFIERRDELVGQIKKLDSDERKATDVRHKSRIRNNARELVARLWIYRDWSPLMRLDDATQIRVHLVELEREALRRSSLWTERDDRALIDETRVARKILDDVATLKGEAK